MDLTMANLFWKTEQSGFTTLAPNQFRTEEQLENFLYKNPQLLGDLVIISRQTKTGNHRDIPDLIGIDADNNVVIIELKKAAATEDIIAQVLRYAIWAETNPDSIKNLWLECTNKPDDRQIDWDSIQIKIMIVAEEIPAIVLRLVNRITYTVELFEISRFISGRNEFVLVNPRVPENISKTIVKPQATYDEAHYRYNFNPASAEIFLNTAEKVERLCKSKGWNLERKHNKTYIAFKLGFPQVCGVYWIGSKSFCIYFKIPKAIAESIHIEGYQPLRYEDEWNQILYKVDSNDYPVEKLMPLFEAAYKHVSGT